MIYFPKIETHKDPCGRTWVIVFSIEWEDPLPIQCNWKVFNPNMRLMAEGFSVNEPVYCSARKNARAKMCRTWKRLDRTGVMENELKKTKDQLYSLLEDLDRKLTDEEVAIMHQLGLENG